MHMVVAHSRNFLLLALKPVVREPTSAIHTGAFPASSLMSRPSSTATGAEEPPPRGSITATNGGGVTTNLPPFGNSGISRPHHPPSGGSGSGVIVVPLTLRSALIAFAALLMFLFLGGMMFSSLLHSSDLASEGEASWKQRRRHSPPRRSQRRGDPADHDGSDDAAILEGDDATPEGQQRWKKPPSYQRKEGVNSGYRLRRPLTTANDANNNDEASLTAVDSSQLRNQPEKREGVADVQRNRRRSSVEWRHRHGAAVFRIEKNVTYAPPSQALRTSHCKKEEYGDGNFPPVIGEGVMGGYCCSEVPGDHDKGQTLRHYITRLMCAKALLSQAEEVDAEARRRKQDDEAAGASPPLAEAAQQQAADLRKRIHQGKKASSVTQPVSRPVRVLQIGANTGDNMNDHLNHLLRTGYLDTVAIEPVPWIFSKLAGTYSSTPQVRTMKVAVAPKDGRTSFQAPRENAGGFIPQMGGLTVPPMSIGHAGGADRFKFIEVDGLSISTLLQVSGWLDAVTDDENENLLSAYTTKSDAGGSSKAEDGATDRKPNAPRKPRRKPSSAGDEALASDDAAEKLPRADVPSIPPPPRGATRNFWLRMPEVVVVDTEGFDVDVVLQVLNVSSAMTADFTHRRRRALDDQQHNTNGGGEAESGVRDAKVPPGVTSAGGAKRSSSRRGSTTSSYYMDVADPRVYPSVIQWEWKHVNRDRNIRLIQQLESLGYCVQHVFYDCIAVLPSATGLSVHDVSSFAKAAAWEAPGKYDGLMRCDYPMTLV